MARASRHRHLQSPLPYFLLTNPADPEAEYQLQHYVAVDISLFVSAIEAISEGSEYLTGHYGPSDISRRELSAPAGAQYLCRSGDGSLNVRTNHRERFHTKTGPVEHPPAFPRPVIGADRQRWHPKRRPVGRIGGHAPPVPIVPVHEITPPLDADAFRTGQGRIRAAHRLGIRGTHTPVHAERPQERQRERSRLRPRRSGTRHGNGSRHVLLVLGRLLGHRLGSRISTGAKCPG